MLFFSEQIAEYNKNYPNLLGFDDEEQETKSRTEGEDDGTEGEDKTRDFLHKWKWQHLTDIVSDTMKIDWHKCYELNITEFLNIVCYAQDKIGYNNEQMKQWKTKN